MAPRRSSSVYIFTAALVVRKSTADILCKRVKIKWEKDRSKEPVRNKAEFPWFWGWDEVKQDFAGVGKEPDGNRWNNCHYSIAVKQAAQAARK